MESLKKQTLFWDVERDTLSPDEDWFFIVERILEFGDIEDLFWMRNTFSEDKIKETVKKSRILSKRTFSYCKAAGYAS